MPATPKQLKDRWATEDGRRRLKEVVKAIKGGGDWCNLLNGFPFATEVPCRRDLRHTGLRGETLGEANFYGVDLSGANLDNVVCPHANFTRAKLVGATLRNANLAEARFLQANLSEATLDGATLLGAIFTEANLRRCSLCNAKLVRVSLIKTCLEEAVLTDADLTGSQLIWSRLNGAKISRARVFGVSAWGLELTQTEQQDLIITEPGKPEITVDDIEVAQFIYLLLNNTKLRSVIDTITSKVVLILGRFTPERKRVLDAIKGELRRRDYLPVLFDFERPANRNITETVSTFAHMARFVIADITDARSIPQELMMIVPNLPSVPVQPLILKGQTAYGMFEHLERYTSVLPTYEYDDVTSLISAISDKVIAPAEAMIKSSGASLTRRPPVGS